MRARRHSNYKRPRLVKPKRAHKNQSKIIRNAGPSIFASVIDRLEPYVRCEYVGHGFAKTFDLTIVNPEAEPVDDGINGAGSSRYPVREIDTEVFSLLHFVEQNVSDIPELQSGKLLDCIQHAADFYNKGIDFSATVWNQDGNIDYIEGLLDPADLMRKLVREAPSSVYPEWPYPPAFLLRKEDPCAQIAKGIEFSTICPPDCANFIGDQIEIAPQYCLTLLDDNDNALPDGATLSCCYTEEWWGTTNILPKVYYKFAGIRDEWRHAYQALPVDVYRQGGIWIMGVPALQSEDEDQCLWFPVLKIDHASSSMELKGTLFWGEIEFPHVKNQDQCRRVTVDLIYAIEEFAYVGNKKKKRKA